MRKKYTNILSELQIALAIYKAKVYSNPEFYLKAAHEELEEVHKVFDKIVYTLSPDYIFDFIRSETILIRVEDFQGKERLAHLKVKKIIDDYLKS